MAATATTEGTSLLYKLRRPRGDYAAEKRWHKFLLDAANGSGGFKGRFGPTEASQLGWAASVYGSRDYASPDISVESYLDRFAREELDRFERRVKVSRYTNYVGPIHELLMSYVSEGETVRTDEPEEVAKWREDVDGNGSSLDLLLRETVQPLASLLGELYVMLDMPPAPQPGVEISKAAAEALGLRPRAIPLFPANLLDWSVDEQGEFVAAKVRIDSEYREGDNILEEPGRRETYYLWTRESVTVYTVTCPASGGETVSPADERPHTWGAVPIVTFVGKPSPGDKQRGISNVSDLAVEARAHYNLSSEERDHIRGQVFAILGVPMKDTSKEVGTIIGGNKAAIKIPMESAQPLHFVAPPATVATTLAAAISTSVKEMHRIARVEYEEKGTAAAASGVARAYQFEKTNKRLAEIAARFARAQQKLLRLVGRALNAIEAEKTTVSAPTDFRVDDLTTDLENVMSALGLGMGPTAEAELKKRTYRKMAPNTPQATLDAIDDEIDTQSAQDEQDSAMDREIKKASVDEAKKRAKNGQPTPDDEAA